MATIACSGRPPIDADYACLAERSAPVPGAEETVGYRVLNPSDDAPFPHAEVHLFTDGAVREGCADGCTKVVADENAKLDVTAPRGWFAYRVLGDPHDEDDARMTTIEWGAVHPPDDAGDQGGWLNALSKRSMTAVFSFTAASLEPGTARLVARGVDCNQEAVANLRPRLFVDDEELTVPLAFLDASGSRPDPLRDGTGVDGRAFLANVPPGLVRIELWGARSESGSEELLACEVVPAEADATTTVRMRPLRADAPPGCAG